jgi:hypothetical protein
MPQSRIRLFGPEPQMVGIPEIEWAVWVLGPDDVLKQPDLITALEVAAEHNACFVELLDGSPHSPTCYAVVLHNGYAWNRAVEHQRGNDCGHPDCGPCAVNRDLPKAS